MQSNEIIIMPKAQFLVILNNLLLVIADKFLQFPLVVSVFGYVGTCFFFEFVHCLQSESFDDFC